MNSGYQSQTLSVKAFNEPPSAVPMLSSEWNLASQSTGLLGEEYSPANQRSTVMYTIPERSDKYLNATMNAGVIFRQLKDQPCDPNVPNQDCFQRLYSEPASYGPDVLAYLQRPTRYADLKYPNF